METGKFRLFPGMFRLFPGKFRLWFFLILMISHIYILYTRFIMPDILPYTKIIKFSGAKEPHIRHDKLRSEKKKESQSFYIMIYIQNL